MFPLVAIRRPQKFPWMMVLTCRTGTFSTNLVRESRLLSRSKRSVNFQTSWLRCVKNQAPVPDFGDWRFILVYLLGIPKVVSHTIGKMTATPLSLAFVQAGFPSPADDYTENSIDLEGLFDVNQTSTFFVRVEGMSMAQAGIQPDDVLCVRKDFVPRDGDIVIAVIDTDFTVKRFRKRGGSVVFEAANEDFPDIIPDENQEVRIWGVVTGLARVFRKRNSP